MVGNELCFLSFCELRYDVRNRILNLLQVPVLGLFFNRLIMNKYGEREREMTLALRRVQISDTISTKLKVFFIHPQKKPSGLSWNYAAACEKLEDIHEACRGGVVQSLHCKTIHVPNFAVQYQRICGISSCRLSNLFKPILLIEH